MCRVQESLLVHLSSYLPITISVHKWSRALRPSGYLLRLKVVSEIGVSSTVPIACGTTTTRTAG